MKKTASASVVYDAAIKFSAEMGGGQPVSAKSFTAAAGNCVRACFPDCKMFFLSRAGEELRFEKDSDAPCAAETVQELLKKSKTWTAYRTKKNSFLGKKYGDCIVIPVYTKREVFFAALICSEKKSFIKKNTPAAGFLCGFLNAEFRRVRDVQHFAKKSEEKIWKDLLLGTQKQLCAEKTKQTWFADKDDYSAEKSTDFSGFYSYAGDVYVSYICDVSAVPAVRQRTMVFLDAYIGVLSRVYPDPEMILEKAGAELCRRMTGCSVSSVCVRYDKKNGKIGLAGAGSCRAFLFRHDDYTVSEYAFASALGVGCSVPLRKQCLAVSPGDILCLCTDGLYQTRKKNGELCGIETLADIVRKSYFMSARDLAKKIYAAVADACVNDPNDDDKTLQIIKVE